MSRTRWDLDSRKLLSFSPGGQKLETWVSGDGGGGSLLRPLLGVEMAFLPPSHPSVRVCVLIPEPCGTPVLLQ